MPGVNPPNNNPLPYALAAMNNRLRALETQQQLVITNRKGQPVMVTGMQPGSNPVRWGIGIVNRNFRQPIAFFGDTEGPTTSTGTVALNFYAADGKTVLVKVNTTGLTVRNAKTGGYQAVAATYETTVAGSQTYSSTAWGPLASNVVVTSVPIGPSGQAAITLSVGYLAPGKDAAGESAFLAAAVDGATTPSGHSLIYSVGPTDGLGSSVTYRTTLIGLTQGDHEFSTLVKVTTPGVVASYTTVTLAVLPL